MPLAGRFLLLVLGLAAIVGAAMVPRAHEWLAVMGDEQRQAQIVAELEPRLATEGSDPTLLATLGRAYAELGDARGIPVLERYLELRPADADALARLGGLYGAAGQVARQRDALERSVALEPGVGRAAGLAALYRSLGLAAEETALLGRFESELTVRNGLLLRLAQVRAEAGDPARAIAALSRPEVVQPAPKGSSNDEERLALAALLAETGEGAEAVRLGRAWAAEGRGSWVSSRLLLAVARRAAEPDAAALADSVLERYPEIRLYLAGQLAESGAPGVARHLLRGWHRANPAPTAAELTSFLHACRSWGEPSILWDAFAGVLRPGADPEIAARYAEAVAAEFGIGALAPFWPALPAGTLARRPLLAARLALSAGDAARAYHLATTVDVAGLGSSDQVLWADLLAAAAPPDAVFATMQALYRKGALPPGLLPRYARLAGSMGHDEAFQAVAAALRTAPAEGK